MASQDARLSRFEADFKQQQNEMTNKINTVLKAITDRIVGVLPSDTVKNLKLGTHPVSSTHSYPTTDPQCSTQIHSSINTITIHPKQPEKSQVDEPEIEHKEGNPEDTNSNPQPQPDPFASIATEQVRKLNSMLESLGLVPQSPNTKFICSKEGDGEVMFIEIIRDDDEPQNESPNDGERTTTEGSAIEYFDTFPTRNELTYHKKLNPKEDANGGVSNFMGRIKGMHVFIGNFTYVIDFIIVEDISSILDPRLSQVVLGRPFIEISNMTHDPPKGVVRFIKGTDEVAYKMPHKIEQYDSLSDLEKEHTKSVYLRNEEDKRRGVEYVMSKILGFYKECLELGPEYLTGVDDEGEVTVKPRDGITSHTRRRHNSSSDGVTYFKTASASTDLNADLEDSFYDGVTVQAYLYDGYWEDIGTIEAFYNANLGITKKPLPDFSCPKSAEGAVIEDSLLMGADYYEIDADRELLATKGRVPIVWSMRDGDEDEDDKNDEINYARLQVLIVSVIGAIMATDYFILLSNDLGGPLTRWFMQANIGIILLCGGTLGWIAVKLIKPEPHMEGLIIAMCATGIIVPSRDTISETHGI
ncbi:MAK10-like protein [Tanacetum coccineum]